MFSDGVSRYNKQLKHVKLKRLSIGPKPTSFEGTKLAAHITKAFSKITDKTDKELHNELCIINVNTSDHKGRLPVGVLTPLLKQAAEGDYPADIIWFCGGPPPIPRGALVEMGITRNKHVCVAAARHNSSESSASEVIAIGASGFVDSMITSGILDFSLSSADSEECANLEEAVATAVGYIAGILHKIKPTGTYSKYDRLLVDSRILDKMIG